MEKRAAFLLVILFLVGFSSAQVFVNEVEINPPGSDSSSEWVEIVNLGTGVLDISGWKIYDGLETETLRHMVPNGTMLDGRSFYSAFMSGLNDGGEYIKLTNSLDSLIDQTPELIDEDDDGLTWSRVPDGVGDFVFQERSKNFPNELPEIINLNVENDETCLIGSENVSVSAEVDGFCVGQVIFSVSDGVAESNFSARNISENIYGADFTPVSLPDSGIVEWKVFVKDCFGRIFESEISTFEVNEETILNIIPSSPSGLNNWYINSPTFILQNSDANQIFYRWDSGNTYLYSGTFGLENAPNNGNVTGGILDLNYWSSLCGGSRNESEAQKILKVDLTDPRFDEIVPADGEIVQTRRPQISAEIDELYQSNSGINLTSVRLKLNGNFVASNVTAINSLDARTIFTPQSDLPIGENFVEIFAKDKAGRESNLLWSFFIEDVVVGGLGLEVEEPSLSRYNTKRVAVVLTLEREAETLEYINYANSNPTFKMLCENCISYGVDSPKFLNLKEGENSLEFRATDRFENQESIAVLIVVDSKKPQISSTTPRKNAFTNGSEFTVKYTEENIENVTLLINGTRISLNDCPNGRNMLCSTSVDLSGFEGEMVEYYFEIFDGITYSSSREVGVFVDTISPEIELFLPINQAYGRRVAFNASMSESVILEYFDLNEQNPRWKKLCSNCDSYGLEKKKEVSFRSGNHELIIRVRDGAGNSDETTASFFVV